MYKYSLIYIIGTKRAIAALISPLKQNQKGFSFWGMQKYSNDILFPGGDAIM